MIRSLIYNQLITPLTKKCYFEVLSRLPDNARLLDVGVGTGKALCHHSNLIIKKKLQITGIDINRKYLQACRKLVTKSGLSDNVKMHHQSFYDISENNFEAVFFSSSFMLLPNQKQALNITSKVLSPAGKIYFTQTLYGKKNPFIESIKPKLKYLTSIEFGKITYQNDFLKLLSDANFHPLESHSIKKWPGCSEQLIIAEPLKNSN